ncbi:MAG TPA: type IV pilus secretin PilQ [Polyangiaceae bacterium]|jgi:type IV pilus assembly protein PilQ
MAAPAAGPANTTKTADPVAQSGQRYATDITLHPPDPAGCTEVVVSFTEPPTYTARLERSATRLLIDVPQSQLKGVPGAITERSGVVAGIMAQAFKTPGAAGRSSQVVRFLVTLSERADYSVAVEGNQLRIRLTPKRADAPSVQASPAKLPTVRAVRFGRVDGEDRVTIESSAPIRYQELAPQDGRRRLVLEGAELPGDLSRTLDVSSFQGWVRRVSSFSDSGHPGRVVIEVESADKLESRVTRGSGGITWSFQKSAAPSATTSGVARDGGVARRSQTVYIEKPPVDLPPVHSGFGALSAIFSQSTVEPDRALAFTPSIVGQAARYTGRRIDLDLKDADIHNVLRLLADVGRVNVVTADNVTGSVSIRMRNVPWDQALDVVLQSKGLGMVRQGNMIRVAPMADLEKERELEVARRQQEVKLAPLETRLIPVSYAEAGDVQARAKPLLSERGSIAVDERTNMLIVRDLAGNLNQIEELTRALDTQTPQVLVEARIVEATSRYLRDVGIQWGGDATFSAATANPTGIVFPNAVGVVGGASDANTPTAGLSPFSNTVANPNFAVNLPATVGTGSGGAIGLTFGSIDNTINLAVRLSAAESNGILRILSSPRILTLDNREARIAQGTLIPFSQVSAQGVQTTFQEAKLQLLVKPHVTAEGSVSMHVKINRDEPDFNQTSPRGDPTILKREAETDLLVMDGHTAVIGGIFTRNTGRNLDQVPFFGDIPILGLLFQRRRASDTRGELIIFLTPRIVNRAEALGR